MKLNFTPADKINKLSFTGFQHKKSEKGEELYEFNFPHDANKYDVYLEILPVRKNEKDEFYPVLGKSLAHRKTGRNQTKINSNGSKINLRDFGLKEKEPFAYRYVLKPQKPEYGNATSATDSGLIISNKDGQYNLVTRLTSNINKGGAMYLAIPDTFAGWKYDENGKPTKDQAAIERAKHTTKNYANKIGGNLAGIENHIDELKKQGYARIVTTPIFTDDSISAHGYWIKNAMQMSQSMGNINNYGSFIKKMFKNDMNFVADGAFVNEGLEGIHFRDVLKRGEKSPYFNWFRAEGLKNGPLSLAVFSKNNEFIKHRLINSPYKYEQVENGKIKISQNESYNHNKPTYVQIIDSRKDGLNPVDINTHEDTIINYSFIIDPETYKNNIEKLNEYQKLSGKIIRLGSYEAARFLTSSDNYSLEEKFEGGFETWDANNDIPKLNFTLSKSDIKRLKRLPEEEREEALSEIKKSNYEVQDYAIAAGKYWSKKTNDLLLEYTAQELKKSGNSPKEIRENILKNENLPKSLKNKLSEKVIENILNGSYKLEKTHQTDSYQDLLLKGIMDMPLDAIELGDDVTAVLSYPYITNRASNRANLGKSRFEIFTNGNENIAHEYSRVYAKTTSMYTDEIFNFADKVMKEVNAKLESDNKLFDGTQSNDFGKYVLPLVGQDIAKFAVIKALSPKAEYRINENGEISYDYKKLKNISLNEVGVMGLNAESDANDLVSKIKFGINRISEDDTKALAESIYKRIKDTNATQFKLAEAIVDRTQAGLDWRIDAAKDIADMDAIRNKDSAFEEIWQDSIDFWKSFTTSVHKENPNSYLAAEITDTYDLHKISGATGRFQNDKNAEAKFLQEAGINTTANYAAFFNNITEIFGKNPEKGHSTGNKNTKIYDILVNNGYLSSAQLESLLYSYTFVGNHDKPRVLHCMAMDMELFYSDLKNETHKKIAQDVLNKKITNPATVSPAAIAMGNAVKASLGKVTYNLYKDNGSKNAEVFGKLSDSIADLAQGKYLGKTFSPEAFGVKPFDKVLDMVFEQAEKVHRLELSNDEKEKIYNETFRTMLVPAMEKLEATMSFLVALPGNPTLFAGDEIGLTGYETACKNVFLQNRSFVNMDLLNDKLDGKNKDFIKKFNEEMNEIMSLRAKPELEPLNSGTPYALELQSSSKGDVSGILRQSTNGDMVISLFNPTGFSDNFEHSRGDKKAVMNKISLVPEFNGECTKSGLPRGITPETVFYNTNGKDRTSYVVKNEGMNYVIRRFENGKEVEIVLDDKTMTNSTLLLSTKTQKSEPSFKGKKVLYNPQYSFVTNPYTQAAKASVGIKLKSNV